MTESIIKLIFQASLTAGIAAAVVMLLRIPLKKVSKRWSYILWAVVFFRCLCPLSVESAVSIFNAVPEQSISEITEDNDAYNYVPIDYDPVYVDYSGNADFNKTDIYENTKKKDTGSVYTILFIIWVSGVSVMLLYAVISYVRLMGKMKTAIKTEDGIYETDMIPTAFSAGLFPPKIYLPCGLSENEQELIITHEQVHIRRLDFIFKPLAFAGLALHWFNPMIWLSFALMTKDMELSCDEAVLKILGAEEKKSYSQALLKVSMKRSGLSALPLAFAGTGIKERVKNVLGYKKPTLVAAIIAAATVLTAGVMLGTDAVKNVSEDEVSETLIEGSTAAVTTGSGDMIFIQRRPDDNDVGLKHLLVYYDDTAMVFDAGGFGKRDVDIDIDPDKITKAVIQDLRVDHYDDYYGDGTNEAFTYIAVDMEFYMTEDNDKAPVAEYSSEYVENNSVITKMCGGNEKQYGLYFEIEVPEKNNLYGYGIQLVGFDNAEIYVRDNLKIVDGYPYKDMAQEDDETSEHNVSTEAVHKAVGQEIASDEYAAEQQRLREEQEKRRAEEQERQKRLDEEREAMEQEKDFLYYSFSDDDGVVSHGAVSHSDINGEGVVINSNFSNETPVSEVSVESTVVTFSELDVILKCPIKDPLNTCLNGIEPYGEGNIVYENGETYFHKGIDFSVPEDTPVYAAADGKILRSEFTTNGDGNNIIIDHGGELMTLYTHLNERLVQEGDEVKAGDLIGYSGKTGNATGATLHFEVRVNGQHVDPMLYLEKN